MITSKNELFKWFKIFGVPTRAAVTADNMGAVGDGTTDNTTALQAIIDAGLPIILKNGSTYKTGNLTPNTSTGKITIRAEYIDKSNPPVLEPTSSQGNVALLFTNHAGGTIEVDSRGVKFYDFSQDIVCGSSFSGSARVLVEDCIFDTTERAIFFNCDVTEAHVYRNEFYDITSSTDGVYGVALGDQTGGYASTTSKMYVHENIFNNIYSSETTTQREVHAIIIKGNHASIKDNHIDTVYAANFTNANGMEAIYTVARYDYIIGNVIIDGGNGEGAIVTKGGDRYATAGTHGYACEIAFNKVMCNTKGRCGVGIYSAVPEDIYIHHNQVDGIIYDSADNIAQADGGAIVVEHSDYGRNVRIEHNNVFNCKTQYGIKFRLIGAEHVSIKHNNIHCFGPTDGTITQVLHVDLNDGDGYDIDISHNKIYHPDNYDGTHDGSGPVPALTDSTASWDTDELVGRYIHNITDGSSGIITSNTATTVTATLSGGTDNDWEASDVYKIPGITTDAGTIVGLSWQLSEGSYTGIRVNYNTVYLDDQEQIDGTAASCIAYYMGNNANSTFINAQVMGNVAIGDHDTDFTSPSTGTLTNCIEAYNSWNNAGAGNWIVETF